MNGTLATRDGVCTICGMAIYAGESEVGEYDNGQAHVSCIAVELAEDERPAA